MEHMRAFWPESAWLRALGFLSVWFLLGVGFSLQHSFAMGLPASEAVRAGFFGAPNLMAILAATAWVSARRFPPHRGGFLQKVAVHGVVGTVVITANVLLMHAMMPYLTSAPTQALTARFATRFPEWALLYGLMLGIAYGLPYVRRYREREIRMAELQAELSRAQLHVLTTQLHPHFLFNTLNSISALLQTAPGEASRMLERLEDLLRCTLSSAQEPVVPLSEELQILEPYLEIEQARFQDWLRIEWQIEPDSRSALVPHLLLQPLVENAIHHGIASRDAPGHVRICAAREGERLLLGVHDNGKGLSRRFRERKVAGMAGDGIRSGGGIGLSNTHARLQQLYPGDHRLIVEDAPEGGVSVTVDIPYHRSASPGEENAS
jgi:two-component system, LytTR family, sensor kinase